MAHNRARASAAAAVTPLSTAPDPAQPAPELKLVAMHEHSLLSMLELSHELTVVLDAQGIADLAVFNLMGHFGTAQAGLFLESEFRPGTLHPIRSHGMRSEIAHALAVALESALPHCPSGFATPLRLEDAARVIEPATLGLAERCGIALIAPIVAGQRPLGFIVLGNRARGEFSDLDLDVLNASLGMVGVAFENRRLYSRLEEQNCDLSRANEELRELDRLKSEFLQNVNHELRTPLAVIIGSVDCLRQEPEVDPRRGKLLSGMLEQAGRLRDMVQTLLDFSSALDGSIEMHVETFDPHGFLAEYFGSRRARVADTHPEFVLDASNAGTRARADRSRVAQVLDVLLDNAVKFTPHGTRIGLRLCERGPDDGAWTRIEFSDDGPGMAPEDAVLLFKPFRQADASMTRPVGGLGMGLATAHRIAERMGGRLTVDSRIGAGATFTLLIPTA